MRRALARQQTLAKHLSRPFETATLQKVALVGDEDIANQVGVVEQKEVLPRHVHVRDVTVGAREVTEERDRIAAGPVSNERAQRSRRARWKGHDRHHASSSSSADETAAGCSRGMKCPALATTRWATSLAKTTFSAGDASAEGRPRPS